MYTGSLHLHHLLQWVILVLALITLYKAFSGRSGAVPFLASDRKIVLFTMIAAHLQLVIGLYQYLFGDRGLKAIQANGMADTMKNGVSRFYAIEHISMMLIAILLLTLANSASKKAIEDKEKWNKIFLFTLFALALILISIPWPFREAGAGRGWFMSGVF
jgi:hypothetical protein